MATFVSNEMNRQGNWIRGIETRIGLALGGGFGRAIAHAGVLRVFEREGIPIHSISGVSSGAIAAAAFASGCTSDEIEAAGRAMAAVEHGKASQLRDGRFSARAAQENQFRGNAASRWRSLPVT